MTGYDVRPAYTILNEHKKPSMIARTLFLQETIKRGILMPYIVPSYAHKNANIRQLLEVVEETLHIIKKAGCEKKMLSLIDGDIVKPVFRKFN